jgi:energy-coupling factor transporter ATP-binding protein EcfA2
VLYAQRGLLILDEPTSAADDESVAALVGIINDTELDITVFVVSHDWYHTTSA